MIFNTLDTSARNTLAMLLVAAGLLALPAQAQSTNPGAATGTIAPQAPAQTGVLPGGLPARPTSQVELDVMHSDERTSQCSEATSPQEPVPVCKLTPADADAAPASDAARPAGN